MPSFFILVLLKFIDFCVSVWYYVECCGGV